MQLALPDLYVVVVPVLGAHNKRWVPPDEHVLDHLARTLDLVDESAADSRPAAYTVAVLDDLPSCEHCDNRARYQTCWNHDPQRAAVFACLQCLRWYGDRWIGLGHSTYLMTVKEVPDQVRRAVEDLCDRRGTPSPWSDPD